MFTYLFGEKIGEGSFSTVYTGINKADENDKVIIKVILNASSNKSKNDIFENEIKKLKILDHPQIPKIILSCEYNDKDMAIVLENKGIKTLRNKMDSYYDKNIGNASRLNSEYDIILLAVQLIDIIDYIHTKNIVHNDIKPENIIWGDKIYLIDFGSAVFSNLNGNTVKYMTPNYSGSAPEISIKSYEYGIDIWSFGVIIFEAIFGIIILDEFSQDYEEKKKLMKNGRWKFDLILEQTLKNKELLKIKNSLPNQLFSIITKCLETSQYLRPTMKEIKSIFNKFISENLETHQIIHDEIKEEVIPGPYVPIDIIEKNPDSKYIINDEPTKFITMIGDKLVLSSNLPVLSINKILIVISFMGKARIGKSTLMNCFLTNLNNDNTKLFNTSNSTRDHCTTGIDILKIESDTHIILLLDVQGLDYKDSKDDCKLMLFVFMISNIIIYNEKSILTNTVLSSFQSLTSVVPHISNENKPNLIFRSIDIEKNSDYDPEINLQDLLLTQHRDQYINVRKSIGELFSNIKCFNTFCIDTVEKDLLKKGDLLNFLSNFENGFKSCCDNILGQINNDKSTITSMFYGNTEAVLTQINSNSKIDCNIFDITLAQSQIIIREWERLTMDHNKYNKEIIVDGTQLLHDNNILPIIKYRDEKMKEFGEKFNRNTTPNIRDSIQKEIKLKFDNIINTAIKKSEEISEKNVEKIYYKILGMSLSELIDDTIKTKIKTNMLYGKISLLNNIKNTGWLLSTKEKYCEKVEEKFEKNKIEAYIIIDDELKLINTFYEDFKNSIDKFIDGEILTYSNYNVKTSFKEIVNFAITKFLDDNLKKWNYNIKKLYYFPEVKNTTYSELWSIDDNTPIIKNLIKKMEDKLELIKDKQKLCYPFVNISSISSILQKLNDNKIQKLCDTMCMYIYYIYKDEFMSSRKKSLSKSLTDIQIKKPDDSSIESLRKFNETLKKEHKELIDGENEVCILNIFDYLDKYINYYLENNKFSQDQYKNKRKLFFINSILVNYTFLLSKGNIHKILTKTDFEKEYSDILPYYRLLQSNNDILLNYEMVKIIIDIRFKKCILSPPV